MKYTKGQLDAMSDFERNTLLAKLSNPSSEIFRSMSGYDSVTIQSADSCRIMVDYCHNWQDIMPLAVEHNLTLQNVVGSGGNYWMAGSNTYHHYCDKSPQRAIACCLILVLQEQQQ